MYGRKASMFKKKAEDFSSIDIEINPKDVVKGKELGSGCYKTVFKGECCAKEVAIAVPKMQKLSDEQRKSLLNEIKIMKNNPHPNIILFMGAVTSGREFQIITELLDGDLEELLQPGHPGAKMSMFERLQLAKDAALGMNWLHKSSPAIIHRDLKTANLLYAKVGDVYQVKVCDFGLSDIKPKRQTTLRDPAKEGAKGTPLYMPPEVMMGKEFNEKADVYSFGMCLWEIVTCEELFPHHSDYEKFVEAICKKGERPEPVPSDTPGLKKLMEDCWHAKPAKRPDFGEINDRLDEILVEAAIDDANAAKFWKTYFLKKSTVTWKDFSKAFYKFLGLSRPYDESEKKKKRKKKKGFVQADDDVLKLRCLRAIVATDTEKSQVDIQWFGRVIKWFGPMDAPGSSSTKMLDNIFNLCKEKWFHGDLTTAAAVLRLEASADPGSFLVRFSSSIPGGFAISRITAEGSLTHARVTRTDDNGFAVNTDTSFATLRELIEYLRPEDTLNLSKPCSGSRFQSIFATGPVVDDDDNYKPVVVRKRKG